MRSTGLENVPRGPDCYEVMRAQDNLQRSPGWAIDASVPAGELEGVAAKIEDLARRLENISASGRDVLARRYGPETVSGPSAAPDAPGLGAWGALQDALVRLGLGVDANSSVMHRLGEL